MYKFFSTQLVLCAKIIEFIGLALQNIGDIVSELQGAAARENLHKIFLKKHVRLSTAMNRRVANFLDPTRVVRAKNDVKGLRVTEGFVFPSKRGKRASTRPREAAADGHLRIKILLSRCRRF